MAKSSGIGMRLYLQGVDASGDVGSIQTMRSSAAVLDVTSIQDSAMVRIYGLRDGEITFNCFFNDADDETFDSLAALPTTNVLCLVLTSTTAGQPVLALTAKQINYDWVRGADGSLTGTVQLLAASGVPMEYGLLLASKTTHASADDETGIDFGAQTTAGAVGFLQHFSAATGTVEYDLEDSSDSTTGVDGAWANLGAFTDVATPYAPIAQRIEVTGTVERWVRASTNGTFTTAVFSMAFRRLRATDYDADA
jgi:hypothetical protein